MYQELEKPSVALAAALLPGIESDLLAAKIGWRADMHDEAKGLLINAASKLGRIHIEREWETNAAEIARERIPVL